MRSSEYGEPRCHPMPSQTPIMTMLVQPGHPAPAGQAKPRGVAEGADRLPLVWALHSPLVVSAGGFPGARTMLLGWWQTLARGGAAHRSRGRRRPPALDGRLCSLTCEELAPESPGRLGGPLSRVVPAEYCRSVRACSPEKPSVTPEVPGSATVNWVGRLPCTRSAPSARRSQLSALGPPQPVSRRCRPAGRHARGRASRRVPPSFVR